MPSTSFPPRPIRPAPVVVHDSEARGDQVPQNLERLALQLHFQRERNPYFDLDVLGLTVDLPQWSPSWGMG